MQLHHEGHALADMHVLYRAHYQSLDLQMELNATGVPFVITSGHKFFDLTHVKDILAALRLAENPRDRVAGFRLDDHLRHHVGRHVVLLRQAEQPVDPDVSRHARHLPLRHAQIARFPDQIKTKRSCDDITSHRDQSKQRIDGAVAVVAFAAAGVLIAYTAVATWTNNLEDWPHPFQFLILYFGLVMAVQLVADDQVWLAPERLQIVSSADALIAVQGVEKGDQASTLVGYVLDGNGDDWVSILLEQPRIVLRVKSDTILQRSVCRLPNSNREVPPLFVSLTQRFQSEKTRRIEDVVPLC